MAYALAPRSSSRTVKPRLDPDFIYGEEVGFLSSRDSRVEIRHTTRSFVSDSPALATGKNSIASSNWTDIKFISHVNTGQNNNAEFSREVVPLYDRSFGTCPELRYEKNGEFTSGFVNNT